MVLSRSPTRYTTCRNLRLSFFGNSNNSALAASHAAIPKLWYLKRLQNKLSDDVNITIPRITKGKRLQNKPKSLRQIGIIPTPVSYGCNKQKAKFTT